MKYDEKTKTIAQKFGEYISSVSSQVDKDGKLQYYLCGSLATIMLSTAGLIEECAMEDNKIANIGNKRQISEKVEKCLNLFVRPIHDIDVINVSGRIMDNSKRNIDGRTKNMLSKAMVQKEIPDIQQLFKNQVDFLSAFSNIDSLEEGNIINKHRVVKLITGNSKEVYITAPESLIAHKLEETIELNHWKNNSDKYKKDIKDLATMIGGISKIYDNDELVHGVSETIKEKENSHFYEHSSNILDIFSEISKDIEIYIQENNLQDTISTKDIKYILGNVVESVRKSDSLSSAIDATKK